MKIEISEVFVTRTDAITTHAESTPVGIAALEPRPTVSLPKPKSRSFSRCFWFFSLFSVLFTLNNPKVRIQRSRIQLDTPKYTFI
ncbi:MAG: hypothetical protein ACXWDN_03130 [Limisphaerales bacterium]